MACSQTLLGLTSSSSSALGTQGSEMVDAPSTSNNLFSSFGSSVLGGASKETSFGLSSFFLDRGIMKMYLSLPCGGKRFQLYEV